MNLLLNLLVPGSGLIAAGRRWLGLSLAALFGLCAHVVVAGFLIAPLAWPRGYTWAAALLAAAAWGTAQYLLRNVPDAPAIAKDEHA